jgi:PAS domain S-box-containing protein
VSFVDSETQHSVQEMETILETLNDGVVIVDDADQILFVNTVFEDSSGIARSEITGREAVGCTNEPKTLPSSKPFA